MEERAFHPLDYVSVLRRRKWWFVVPLVLCVVGGALLAAFLPRTYHAQAEIGVDAATLSPELLRGVQSLDPGERQRAISQQLLSPVVLERVAREAQVAPHRPAAEVAAGLRSQVQIDVAQPIGRPTDKGFDSFFLGYMDSTPERTRDIANRLAQVFVEENSKIRLDRAQNTATVLEQEMRASKQRLDALEEQLRLKKEANMGRLPDQVGTNISMVNGLRQQLESLSMQLRGEQDRLSLVESQIEAMQQGTAGMALTSSAAASIQAAQTRLTTLQQQLVQARSVYTDKHPEISRLQDEIAQAKADVTAVRQDGPSGSRADVLNADPVYKQKVTERDGLRSRIRGLQQAESSTRSRIAQFESAVAAAPRVEQDMSAVQRDVEHEKVRYADIQGKFETARLAEDLSRKQGGERFSVRYDAALPTTPVSPDVLRLMLMAVALGLALGAAMVVGREFMDRSVHDARALQSEFEIPVLGEIPRIEGTAQAGLSH